MKKYLSIVLLLFSMSLFSQEVEYQAKIDSLNSLIANNNEQITSLQQKNDELNAAIRTYNQKQDSILVSENRSDIVYSIFPVAFYSDQQLTKRYKDIPSSQVVTLIAETDELYNIQYDGNVGYAKKIGFITNLEYLKRLEREENKKKEAELAEQSRIEAEKAASIERERIKQQEAASRKKALEERTKEMIKKYGSYNGKLIAEGKVAIGMNQKMVIDSWGKPSDINRDIYSFGVHEQWVYGSGNYVYFKDGVVSSISTRK